MGWTYNTADDIANDGPQITAVAIVLTSASLSILLLRMYVRVWMIKAVGADDWTLIFTWIASCGFAVVTIAQTKWGLGLKHLIDMPPQNIYNFGLIQYMGAPFYITSILGFKLSLLFTYLRFMTKGGARNATITVIVACIAFHISFLLVQVNLCQPVAKQWDPAILTGKCLPAVPFYTSVASLTILFDVAVMILPFPVLVKSQIQKRKKFALLGLLTLGTFITIIQVIRIQTVKNLANYLDSSKLIMWSTVENNLGIIVASIPTLAPLFKYYAEKTQKSSTAKSASQSRSRSLYALKSLRSTRQESLPLGSGVDHVTHIGRGGRSDGESAELILGDVGAITKKIEVTISRSLSRGMEGKDGAR
ncbi:hypothetical protein HBI56_159650 [Parastagonospora nodorum]|uniref:Rhodopsin domain-containing protein n=1 Tax=Phaeosphaeria nodorum (strain SN15 / ATCC MYA-4574 / FGSC 10173) TaxID=321614 RepID=A0A7U2ET98_PHANO|nr:hypothetical protein HBH56_190360 [Parastagonospora nodorum]QRC92402.1 hypothetical protein JI435_025160 [Parastagonospora nodorum SN15]KAH3925008.1 hypothetical protein HBH54_186170 [Parastagonospora nodorum]KAH3954522.1 hypothetical protein HBH53_025520 [Parastagonospora nodorum]KAH3963717.1 hypothetical protein HBH51_165350 [Parastagonospora nodorum]